MNNNLFKIILITSLIPLIHTLNAQETIPQDEIDSIYLSDFLIKRDKIVYHDVGVGLDHVWNSPGSPLTLNGVEYEKGLGTMAHWGDSYIEYYLDGQFTRFTAVVGLDDLSIYNAEDDELMYPFEWILVDTAGNFIRQYRGCSNPDKTPDKCDSIDYYVSYWPGNDDHNNQWVNYYIENSPDRRIIMTRPACQGRVLVDNSEVFHTGNVTISEYFSTPPQFVDIDLTNKDKLVLDIIADGYQHEPFEDSILVSRCPWRDRLDWADAKLYYRKSVTGISIESPSIRLNKNVLRTLYVEVEPEEAYMKFFKMESSNPDVVLVMDPFLGEIYTNGYGTATIKVTSFDGNYVDECEVVVPNPTEVSHADFDWDKNFLVNTVLSQGTVYFDFSDINTNIENLQIFSLTGKLIWSKKNIKSKKITVDLGDSLPKGIYIISLYTNKERLSKKLVIN